MLLDVQHRQSEPRQQRTLVRRLAIAPHEHEVGPRGEQALRVEAIDVADARHALRRRRVVAHVDRADEALARAGREHELGQVRRQRDDALRRGGEGGRGAEQRDERDEGAPKTHARSLNVGRPIASTRPSRASQWRGSPASSAYQRRAEPSRNV